ncbi:4-hydroxybenzoate polyprenyltransferase [Liberibacter crescens BT-1]|uniref:4-hydroxybenzoate octaprenyltransferase n=1 Tax=Liberibacter crescens (strain BT-1) TaxID=1215343 RepID=L0EWQ4_LIBCB|nr:4-hydroxybenzoate octaprenyltransferase [Liberibacter crescens]AGA64811.1 4-hydroxybenzoate polyprenyltransferase [Liberibacter crescens BT-1]AMC12869.1 4-hydroxybenzoate polyprenyltransferase [Liberibacter crescens]
MTNRVADAPNQSWVYKFLPPVLLPYAQLARWDRVVGSYLLMWPCFWSATLAAYSLEKTCTLSYQLFFWHLALYYIGTITMRGAGCTWNDIIDKDIDALVSRTRSRPLPSGRITLKKALFFMVVQLLIGFIVLIQFNNYTIFLGLGSMLIVPLYPFTKRFTNWPQFFLGLCFAWGALIGWSALHNKLSLAALCLYAGTVCWIIGYDTIYAHQDKSFDELIGVKSTAILFADHTKRWLCLFYSLCIVFLALSFYLVEVTIYSWIGLLSAALLFIYQIIAFDGSDPDKCLALFKSNNFTGLLVFTGLLISLLSI